MLKVAVAASGSSMDQWIPDRFDQASYLLILDAESEQILETIQDNREDSMARSLFFSQKVVDYDCEAILCGELEREAFAILAEENCVTRYQASGLSILDSIKQMNAYALPLITDYIGGSGCPDNDPENCALHHDHTSDHDHD